MNLNEMKFEVDSVVCQFKTHVYKIQSLQTINDLRTYKIYSEK